MLMIISLLLVGQKNLQIDLQHKSPYLQYRNLFITTSSILTWIPIQSKLNYYSLIYNVDIGMNHRLVVNIIKVFFVKLFTILHLLLHPACIFIYRYWKTVCQYNNIRIQFQHIFSSNYRYFYCSFRPISN